MSWVFGRTLYFLPVPINSVFLCAHHLQLEMRVPWGIVARERRGNQEFRFMKIVEIFSDLASYTLCWCVQKIKERERYAHSLRHEMPWCEYLLAKLADTKTAWALRHNNRVDVTRWGQIQSQAHTKILDSWECP